MYCYCILFSSVLKLYSHRITVSNLCTSVYLCVICIFVCIHYKSKSYDKKVHTFCYFFKLQICITVYLYVRQPLTYSKFIQILKKICIIICIKNILYNLLKTNMLRFAMLIVIQIYRLFSYFTNKGEGEKSTVSERQNLKSRVCSCNVNACKKNRPAILTYCRAHIKN